MGITPGEDTISDFIAEADSLMEETMTPYHVV